MLFGRIVRITVLLILVCLVSVYGERTIVNSGHIGGVNQLTLSQNGASLYSVGDDGTIREFHARTGNLIRTTQASPFPITSFVIHPDEHRLAFLEDDGVSIYRLSVWDLPEERLAYSVLLEERPLHFDFSPKGTYLVYTRADWDSVVVLDADSGTPVTNPDFTSEPLMEGFGLVSAFLISKTEKTFVAYLSSGSLQYRTMENGQLKVRFPTLPNLSDVHFIPPEEPLYAIGRQDDDITVIDLLTGEDLANKRVDNIQAISVDANTNEILVLHEDRAGAFAFSLLAFQSRRLVDRYSLYTTPDDAQIRSITISNRTVYIGLDSGVIMRQTRFQTEPVEFSRYALTTVDDLLAGDSTFITTRESIITVHFDVLPDGTPSILTFQQRNVLTTDPEEERDIDTTDDRDSIDNHLSNPFANSDDPGNFTTFMDADETSSISDGSDESSNDGNLNPADGDNTDIREGSPPISSRDNPNGPFIDRVAMKRLGNDLYLLYDHGGTSGDIAYFSPVTGLLETLDPMTAPPIVSLDMRGFDQLTVNGDGVLALTNLFTKTEFYSFERTGLGTAIFANEPYIFTSGQRAGVPRTTTLRINTETFETVSLENDSTLTFALAYDPVEGALYSANINRNIRPTRTEITKHFGPALEEIETVFAIDGEFFDSSITTRRGIVFVSVGGVNLVKRSRRGSFSRIDDANAIPRSTAIYGDWLYSVNRDSSISVWRIDSGQHVATFYLLENQEWATIAGDGTFIDASGDAMSYLKHYE